MADHGEEGAVARRHERWRRKTPLGRLYTWLVSVPGSLVYNTPAYKLHEELQLHAENRVLDIGCGRGSTLQLLTARVRFERTPVGIDLSRALLQQARRETPGVEFVQASGTALPVADEAFDVVTCAYVTQRLDNDGLLALLKEIRRVLSPGGIALIWDFAATRSQRLNEFHGKLLEMGTGVQHLRTYTTLSAYALEAGFEWVSNAHLRPFLFPPIPRVSIIIGKAPIGWEPEKGVEGLTPDTRARSLVAGVTQERVN